jgi:hypothetical protein
VGCVLRVAGRDFDVDAYLMRGALVPNAVYRRGEARFPTLPRARKSLESGFSILVSKTNAAPFAEQTEDAVSFLAHHRRAIRALRRHAGVETAVLDFRMEQPPEFTGQGQVFPEELVRLSGELGLALELSFYPATGRPPRESK